MSKIQKSTIVLYMDVPLKPEQNKLVEDIETYLENQFSSGKITVTDYNYFKNEFETEIAFKNNSDFAIGNFDFQTLDIGKLFANNYNYIKVIPRINEGVNEDAGSPLFYFVTGTRWTSEKSVRLSLRLDTLNTFPIGTGYSFGGKSHILRQHKDRMEITSDTFSIASSEYIFDEHGNCDVTVDVPTLPNIVNITDVVVLNDDNGSYTINYHYSYAVISLQGYSSVHQAVNLRCKAYGAIGVVDRYSEGFQPRLFKSGEKDIYYRYGGKWYLVYMNHNNISTSAVNLDNPIDCFLAPETDLLTDYKTQTITVSDITSGYAYMFSSENNGDEEFDVYGDGVYLGTIRTETPRSNVKNYHWGYIYADSGSLCYVQVIEATLNGSVQIKTYENKFSGITKIVTTKTSALLTKSYDYDSEGKDPEKLYTLFDHPTTHDASFALVTTEEVIFGISHYDNTDERMIKIIELPYAPSYISYSSSSKIRVPNGWQYDVSTHLMSLVDARMTFENQFGGYDGNGVAISNPNSVLLQLPSGASDGDSRQQTNGVDDYEYKLYHSEFYQPKFVYDSFSTIFPMEQVNPTGTRPYFEITFIPTSTINSKFLFKFEDFIDSLRFSEEDYPGIVSVARNNEKLLLNSQYTNYIRNGYNYDVKAKNRRELSSLLSIAGNVGTMIAGAGNPLGVMAGAAGMVNNISNMVGQEEQMEEKLRQLRLQAVTVEGSDDIDLLNAYSGNRAKLCTYEASPRVRQQLSNLFYYFGYTEDKYGTPDTSSRIWFNYVQGDMVINPIVHLSEIVMNDIKNRYSAGVTIFHKRNNSWDINQTKENWEGAIL